MGFSCSSTKDQQEIIPSATMVELLIDIHILEARVDKLRLSNDSAYAVYNTLERELFEKRGVDKPQYEVSYQYYLSNPILLDKIYTIVVDSLNVIQKRGYQEDSELMQVKLENDSMAVEGDSLTMEQDSLSVSLDSLAVDSLFVLQDSLAIVDSLLVPRDSLTIASDTLRQRKATIKPRAITRDSVLK
ncbi:DUF4296 domain-containing protein [Reichenbachiella carrageenanivorans]|uniref:DUF4296 domain-containing protein n=1 Tax=Reichenbachiella carrageenanivorans TaxID=2979869 RepID=A0ABY6D1V3_9BACT|nr:DUF4296 domain-containing protein [Reichenbachiella carrageenanivorans]UXX79048.1 DUF4296 domain-containing protein [Reichenbachiella carrageenanivorans]